MLWEPGSTEPDLSRDDASATAGDVDFARLERAMRRLRFATNRRIVIPIERSWWRTSISANKRLSADAWRAAFAAIRNDR